MKKCTRCEVEKELSEFGKKKDDKLQPYCKDCQREYQKEWYSQNKDKKIKQAGVNRKKHREWYRELKKTLSCETCGEDHPATLEFHHSDPEVKEFEISNSVRLYGKKKLMAEIEKCQILCANCHRKLHYDMRDNAGMM